MSVAAPRNILSLTESEAGLPGAVADFARRFLNTAPDSIEEIGNGNLNHVYRASAQKRSVIIKQALPYVRRVGRSWPLTVNRLRIEARAYEIHSQASPGSLPSLLGYDDGAHLLALEDLHDATDWRTELNAGTDNQDVAAEVGLYSARVFAETGTLLRSASETATIRSTFHDADMQVFAERMAFIAPYTTDPTNAWPSHLSETAERIRSDRLAMDAAVRGRWIFRTTGECLLHGDLHSGSIMAMKDHRARIIDLEFAFVGPIAFDIGTLLAHLVLARIRRTVIGGNTKHIDAAAAAYWTSFSDALGLLISKVDYRSQELERRLVSESSLFAGIEILRRIGGHFHVDDFRSLDVNARARAEQIAVNAWYSLACSPSPTHFEELWDLAIEPKKDYA